MKIRTEYLIPVLNCVVILIAWTIIHCYFGQANEEGSNIFFAVLSALATSLMIIHYTAWMLMICFSVSAIATAWFYYRTKRQLFLGFRNSLILNLLIIISLVIIAQFQ